MCKYRRKKLTKKEKTRTKAANQSQRKLSPIGL